MVERPRHNTARPTLRRKMTGSSQALGSESWRQRIPPTSTSNQTRDSRDRNVATTKYVETGLKAARLMARLLHAYQLGSLSLESLSERPQSVLNAGEDLSGARMPRVCFPLLHSPGAQKYQEPRFPVQESDLNDGLLKALSALRPLGYSCPVCRQRLIMT